jgi:putative PIN family toxin of toxin-antitoxin system
MSGIIYNTSVSRYRIVIDTNVIVSAFRSKRGASYALFMLLGTDQFVPCVSVPLVIEYEKLLSDKKHSSSFTKSEIAAVLDYLCSVSEHTRIYYLWRPLLHDSKDDMILELAVASKSDFIVTFNINDFQGAKERFAIKAITPGEFLRKIGG